MKPSPSDQPIPTPPHWLGWAAFLACSWTWVIGMALPVLLIRDMGAFAWIAFAVPNVLGAAAMGFTINSPAHSDRHHAAHLKAMRAFSWVTIAFHVYVTAWLTARLMPNPLIAVGLVAGVFLIVRPLQTRSALRGGVVVWALSMLIAAACFRLGVLEVPVAGAPLAKDTVWLAIVCVFGFALCPYLDLTFHRVSQSNEPDLSQKAFAVGFGVLFLAMICFTMLYATWMNRGAFDGLAGLLIGVHFAVQTGYTIAVHARELPGPRSSGGLVSVAGVLSAIAIAGWLGETRAYHGLSLGEAGYRIFMSFYGLVFPAYVWIAMIPFWRNPISPGRGTRLAWAATVLAAMPFYWLAFIERQTVWVAVGVFVALAGRLLVIARRSPPHPARIE